MKTGRAVCRSQAWDSTLPEKSSFFHPNPHSQLLPSPCIHQPLCSITWLPLLDSTTLSNRPDGLSEIHRAVYIHLNHHNATALLSYFISKHSFTKVSTEKPAQSHFEWAWYEAMCRSLNKKRNAWEARLVLLHRDVAPKTISCKSLQHFNLARWVTEPFGPINVSWRTESQGWEQTEQSSFYVTEWEQTSTCC